MVTEIENIIESAPFEVSSVERLEIFLRQQLTNQTYSFEANQILMKNYLMHTKLLNVDNIAQILILSLMRLPSTDYLALSYLIPVVVTTNPSIAAVAACANCLERGKFQDFWIEYSNSPSGLFNQAAGFVGAMRSFILNSLANTFRNIPISAFLGYLGLADTEINAFIAASPRALMVCYSHRKVAELMLLA